MKRVELWSGWALVQSKEGGGMPTMSAVCEMGGERRLGVGVGLRGLARNAQTSSGKSSEK